MSIVSLPTGTVTFLFTDIEGSTRLVQSLGEAWADVLDDHHVLLREAVESNGGTLINTEGDAVFAVFTAAADGVRSTVDAQRNLARHDWPSGVRLLVRMGIHTGDGILGGSDYVGLDVHRAARIAAAGHGGQTVLSETTAALVERGLPEGVGLRDLGKHRLKDLTEPETLFDLEIDGLPSDFPPLRTIDAIPNNLPVQLTSFVGRRTELDEVKSLLGPKNLVTLTGPGGTGKTRLALQAGAEMSDEFADGVFFADLSTITDSDVVASQVLDALGAASSRADMSPADSLIDHMTGMELLLIVDNFEHVIDAAALVSDLVRNAPDSRFLVTSRSPLRITGEQTYEVQPLARHADDDNGDGSGPSDAIRLFEERATAVRPDFELTPATRSAAVELMERLDGLPLAIELVASRARLFSVDTILDRLDARMVGSGAVDLPERQRTLDGAIGWSYDLLHEPERRLFARLSVFAGPARLEEIEELCGPDADIDVIEGLEALADQSLVRVVGADTEPRYGMLHVIRQYATERLGESHEETEVRNRHLVVYTGLAEDAAPHLQRADRSEWLNLVAEAHDNVRAALDWAIESGEVDLAGRLASAVWRFWQARGHLHEARRRIQAVVELPGGDPVQRAKALEALGGVLWWQGETQQCLVAYEEAVTLLREAGDPSDVANALYNYALALGVARDADDALAVLAESEAIYREEEDDHGLGDSAWGRGMIAGLVGGDDEVGLREWKRSIDHYRRAGNEFGVGWSEFQLAWLHQRQREPKRTWSHLRSGLELFAGHRDVSAVVLFIALATVVASDLGDDLRAARLGGAFHSQRQSAGSEMLGVEDETTRLLDEERLESLSGEPKKAYLEGLDMDFDEAVAYTLAGPIDDSAE